MVYGKKREGRQRERHTHNTCTYLIGISGAAKGSLNSTCTICSKRVSLSVCVRERERERERER